MAMIFCYIPVFSSSSPKISEGYFIFKIFFFLNIIFDLSIALFILIKCVDFKELE